jgi:diacylglycerol kinase
MNLFHTLAHKLTYAWRGLRYVAHREVSFRLELAAAIVALALAGWFQFAPLGWALLLLTIAVVLAAEIVNTVLERLMDLIEPRLSLHIALLKDMLAGALAIIALTAALIGWLC